MLLGKLWGERKKKKKINWIGIRGTKFLYQSAEVMGHQTELTVPGKRKTAYVCEGQKIMEKSIFCYGKHRAHQNTDIGSCVLALCKNCATCVSQSLFRT